MATRRVKNRIRSVLHNFADTYISRYSDHRGYWLFGQLPQDLERLRFDLLGDPADGDATTAVAQRLAIRRFNDQLLKSGLERSVLREATAELTRDSTPVWGWRRSTQVQGHDMEFLVRIGLDDGFVCEKRRILFAAPHDPSKELRRAKSSWGE